MEKKRILGEVGPYAEMGSNMEPPFETFPDFYRFYLVEHSDLNCRRLHFAGSALVLCDGVWAIVSRDGWWLLLAPVLGYGFAWVGHFFFQKNRPATFRYPLWSLLGDWRMFWDILRGHLSI